MFTTELELKESPWPDFWAVASPLTWADGHVSITVPVGFLTDLASVPRILRNLPGLDPDGESRSPAVLHDWLYRTHQFTRLESDRLFKRALMARGCRRFDAWCFYLGVRIGGAAPYAFYRHGPLAHDFDLPENFRAWRLGAAQHPLD